MESVRMVGVYSNLHGSDPSLLKATEEQQVVLNKLYQIC